MALNNRHKTLHAAIVVTLIGLITLLTQRVSADDSSAQASDKATLISAFTPYVKTLDQEVTTYSWTEAAALPSELASAQDPVAQNFFKQSAQVYWNRYGYGGDKKNVFGPGLYLASDAVVSTSFGGQNPNAWRLLQVRLPKNFRFVKADAHVTFDPWIVKVLRAHGCPAQSERDLFQQIGTYTDMTHATQDCHDLIKSVFKDALKIQGIAYDYAGAPFAACKRDEHQEAFVITDASAASPDDVKAFSPQTKDATDDRVAIQSQFFQATVDRVQWTADADDLKQALAKHPGHTFDPVTSSLWCGEDVQSCQGKAWLLQTGSSPQQWVMAPVTIVRVTTAYPQVLSSRDSAATWMARPFMWADLEGQSSLPDPNRWIKQNLFGCE